MHHPLNNSITLFYTSCTIVALPLGLFITSDEFEVTIEKAINLLKSILPPYEFFGHGPQVGPFSWMIQVQSVMLWKCAGRKVSFCSKFEYVSLII